MSDSIDASEPESRWLLISDVDDTLTGDDDALSRFTDAIATRRPRLRVALNSSRPAASVDATLAEVFPAGFRPDAVITAMGTQIRVAGEWVDAWTKRFEGWPRDEIDKVVVSLGHRAHDAEYQTPHKASFAVPRGEAQEQVKAELDRRGLPCRIIASGSDDLDILPPGGGKDEATLFLAQHLGVDPASRLVVAGDSANDLAMFNVSHRCVAVGNARGELLDAMPAAYSYHAPAKHAAGVLEGLEHFGVWV
ncbi:MAG: HAD-IIB family hydrolase [Planctomycetota bacterium]